MDSSPPAPGLFPATRHSVVLAARDPDPEVRRRALDVLIATYWKPVYKYIRVRWQATAEEAPDLTQGFFLLALEKRTFDAFDARKAKFRTFLRTCVDHYVANERKAARRLKRGGGQELLSLDFTAAEGELERQEIPDPFDMEEYFHREWLRSLFGQAVDALRRSYEAAGKTTQFAAFSRYDLDAGDADRPTYAALGLELGIPATQVTNYLSAARRDLKALLFESLRQTTGSDEELRAESREVLGRRGR